MFVRLAKYLVRFRWIILPIVAAATFACAAIAPRVRFDFTPQAIFAGHGDLVTYSEEFKETFGYEDAVLVVLVEANGERDVLDREMLSWQARVAKDLVTLRLVEQVRCVATMRAPRIVIRPPWIVPAPLIRQFPVDLDSEAHVRAALDRFDLVNGTLVSRDRRVAALLVSLDPDARDVDTMAEAEECVANCLHANPSPPGFRLHLAGFPALRVDIVRQLRADLVFLLPIAGLALLAALASAYRCVSGTLVPLLAVAAGMAWTAAVFVLTDQTLGIISSILPILMLTIGMSNCVHVVSHYAELCAAHPGQRVVAVSLTIGHMASACLLTFLTTAIGFLSLAATRSQVLMAFGWQAALGMGFLYVSTIVVSGVLLPLFQPPRCDSAPGKSRSLNTYFVAAAAHWVVRRPWTVLLGSAALAVASLWTARDVCVNSTMMESYDGDHPTIQAMRLVESELSGFISLEVSLTADRPGRFLEPEIYRQVARAQHVAQRHESVLLARSYVDLHRKFHRRQDGLAAESLPLGEAGRDLLQRSERTIRPLAKSLDYNAFMSPDGKRARIMLRVQDIGTRRALALIDDLERALAGIFPPQGPIDVRLTGDAYVHAKTIDSFIRALLVSLFAASVVIFALIAVLFRSLWIGLISIAPNLTPMVLTLGYMALRGYDLNISHVIVFAISLGVAVDGTIHFLARLQREEGRSSAADEAIERTFQGTGRAIMLANLLVLCGLAVLSQSGFVPTRRFAELGSVTMLGALVGDLLLLPACLMLYLRRRGRTGTSPRLS
jgi:predicted RND superfamily exporter protein